MTTHLESPVNYYYFFYYSIRMVKFCNTVSVKAYLPQGFSVWSYHQRQWWPWHELRLSRISWLKFSAGYQIWHRSFLCENQGDQSVKIFTLYTLGPKLCGHLNITPMCFFNIRIQILFHLCCSHSSGKAYHYILKHDSRDLCSFCISEVGHRGLGVPLVYQFITMMFSEVEVRALCTPIQVLHTSLDKPSWTLRCAKTS